MKPSDFQLKDTYYFTAHSAFRSDEKFTVTKVEVDYIVVQSNQPRWIDCPMIVPMEALSGYQDFGIKFVNDADMRHAIRLADAAIENTPQGELIRFEEVQNEQGKAA